MHTVNDFFHAGTLSHVLLSKLKAKSKQGLVCEGPAPIRLMIIICDVIYTHYM